LNAKKIITLTNVDIVRDERKILSGINLNIHAGELIYLIGKVGSGKSSFMKTLFAELPLTNGEIVFENFKIHQITNQEIPFLRRRIGMVFQDFQLLTDRTVYDNLLFVLKATGWKNQQEMQTRIETVLQEVGMMSKKSVMPYEMSGGEQQRVVIARALLNNPPLILADEPTGNLDPETGNEIMNIFLKLQKKGTTVIMATHNYQLVNNFLSRVFKFADSKINDLVPQKV